MPDLPPHASLPLTMRPCVIGGETARDDYSVICDGVSVGRITLSRQIVGHPEPWEWCINCAMVEYRSDLNGRAASLEHAKRDWKLKWDEVLPDIETERRLHAEFVARMARIGKPVE